MWVAYRHYLGWQRNYVAASAGNTILEVGCGPGYLLHYLAKEFPLSEIIGLDKETQFPQFSTSRVKSISLIKGDAEVLPIKNDAVSAIFALHIIEHLWHPERLVSEASRILQPNGLLFLATPNPMGIGSSVMGAHWCGRRTDHVSVRKPTEWKKMLNEAGFRSIRTGTTGLSGIPIFRYPPLAILNYLLLALFGILPWSCGEAFIGIFRLEK